MISAKRCVIWGAAPVSDSVKKELLPTDYMIAADGGWKNAEKLGFFPSKIVGDFDSSECPNYANVIQLPPEKDDTDTHYATKLALSMGFEEFLYLGVIGGTRLDHTIAAIQSALYAAKQGCRVQLTDGYCKMWILSGQSSVVLPPLENHYFSLFALGGKVSGVYEQGAKYELEDATLHTDFPIGVSNEFVGKEVFISIKQGNALLMTTPKT